MTRGRLALGNFRHPREADVTKPPLIAWTALKLYETSGHRDFSTKSTTALPLESMWFDHNDDDHDGVVQYNHGFSSDGRQPALG